MVTGWNEWIAGRWGKPGGPVEFVDQFDEEYSRDIEPMKGGHGDNYYYQLVANVRRYKGADPLPRASRAPADPDRRRHGPVDRRRADVRRRRGRHRSARLRRGRRPALRDHSGRNDLVALQGRPRRRDRLFLRPHAATADAVVRPQLDVAADRHRPQIPGPAGRVTTSSSTDRIDGDRTTWLEKNDGGWRWKTVAKVSYRVAGNELHLAIPRESLGIPRGRAALSLDFKWADNLQHPGDVMDFYISGDVAPEGRFQYRYVAE